MSLAALGVVALGAAAGGAGPSHADGGPFAPPPPEAARLFAARLDPDALDQAIAAYAELAGRSPTDVAARLGLARAEIFWADLHPEAVPGHLEDLAGHLTRGVQAAREALRLSSPGYAEAARQAWPLPQALQAIEPGGALALYWVGAGQHRLAAARGLAALLVEADDLKRLFARVIELAPDTFHGGAYLHAAALALALPSGYASSLATAAELLAQAERLGPGLLAVPLLWAERWAVKAQDYGVFQRKLAEVLDAQADADPDLAPENELAKRRAQALLKSASLLFTRAAIARGEPPKPKSAGAP